MSDSVPCPAADMLPPAQHRSAPPRRWIALLAVALVALIGGAAASASALLLSGWRKPVEQRYGVAFFLDKEITEAQAATVRTELARVPATNLRYESSADAFARFKETYKDKPELIKEIEKSSSKDSMPASFRLTIAAADFDCPTMAAIRALPGVRQYSVLIEPIDQKPSFQVRCD